MTSTWSVIRARDWTRRQPSPVTAHRVNIVRVMSPRRTRTDARTEAVCLVRSLRPDVVHAHTPKGGLLFTLAAKLAGWRPGADLPRSGLRFPRRWRRGRRGVDHDGDGWLSSPRRHSGGLRRAGRSPHSWSGIGCLSGRTPNVRRGGDGEVPGWSVGCTVTRYAPENLQRVLGPGFAASARSRRTALVVGFVGRRMTPDRGIEDLWSAWRLVRSRPPGLHRPSARPEGPGRRIPVSATVWQKEITEDPGVRWLPWLDDVAPAYCAMDLVCLRVEAGGLRPASGYRGSGNAPRFGGLQSGGHGRRRARRRAPALLVDDGDVNGLAEAVLRYLDDPAQREAHGDAARERVLRDFAPERIYRETLSLYLREQEISGRFAAPGRQGRSSHRKRGCW